MAGLPDHTGGSGPGWNEPEYEVIGGGMIDDQPSKVTDRKPGTGPPLASGNFSVTAGEAWRNTRESFTSWWFWLACALGIALAWGIAAALVAWAESSGGFEAGVANAVHLLMAAFLALSAAVLGAVWGFRHPNGSVPSLLLAGAMRGVALAVPACAVLMVVGFNVGGPIALAGAAVVVIVLEVALFGLIGAGSRRCFAKVMPAGVLAVVLMAFLCIGNVAVTVLLLPATTGTGQASVPVNVERDDSGRITAYECVGNLRPVEVAHTDRVAWLATTNPALLLGSVGGELAPTDNPIGWMLSGLQWAADGPSREVPCLSGESSDGLAPSMPVALTGLVLQAALAALAIMSGRWLADRRAAAGSGPG
ncbi:hypothetical protein J3A64_003017 [Pseudarthrobacter sp. PvP004]|uniref:hypothetical protein n=1 Tax=Pseudarthrobacter sp. PvP004 TaxID=2817850 RepID=UPI0025701AA4|nr:hypothetical protein [Pseudarthrobacter sp. PvP004]MBP2267553.1 hypothetical protein [Pseudarthrobacter sp. PvP004]